MPKPKHGNERVKKDALDLRDLYYEPHLHELRSAIDNETRVPRILDQKSEGACVGFASAAVVNYLLANRDGQRDTPDPVSPRMLYELAKRYDEWEGEDYEGTSLRGAMKGWFHHGVTTETLWPYHADPKKQRKLTPEAALDAMSRPLGAYYRVRHRHLNHMHAAIHETGILLASAAVHSGWDAVGPDGGIVYQRENSGGHAFAIIGYDKAGFWIQNSWGSAWGFNGFGHLLYEDWLNNGWDCWVARMGVPVEAFTRGNLPVASRARFEYVPRGEVDPKAIDAHFVHTGEDGRLKPTGRFGNDADDVAAIVHERIPATTTGWSRRRILLYAHGGLNSSEASAARIASMRETFLANEIYPIHFMWESGLFASLLGAAKHALSFERTRGIGEKFSNLLDEAIEIGARPLGRALWREMQRRAQLTNEAEGGADTLVKALATLRDAGTAFEIHLAGHSAGTILHSHLISRLVASGFPIESVTFLAPACTHELFATHVMPHRQAISRLAVCNLLDPTERDDGIGPYRKSLLYLVSNALEARRHERLLGLETCLGERSAAAVKRFLGTPISTGSTTCGYFVGGKPPAKFLSNANHHGDFDEDDATLNALLRVVRKTTPTQSF